MVLVMKVSPLPLEIVSVAAVIDSAGAVIALAEDQAAASGLVVVQAADDRKCPHKSLAKARVS
jgi:hypothetical protein